jgi:uncharacterized protein (DUF1778 family)
MPERRGPTARVEAGIASEAQDAARQTVGDVQILRLSRKAQEQFASLILTPPQPTPALIHACRRRRDLVAE